MRSVIPCDGRDDLCQHFDDERNCDRISYIEFLIYLMTAEIILIAIIFGPMAVISTYVTKSIEQILIAFGWMSEDRSNESDIELSPILKSTENYERFRLREDFASNLTLQIKATEKLGPVVLKEFCQKFYELEVRHNSAPLIGDAIILHERAISATNNFFFEKLGTSDISDKFFDNVEPGLMLRFKIFIFRKLPNFWAFMFSSSVNRPSGTIHLVAVASFLVHGGPVLHGPTITSPLDAMPPVWVLPPASLMSTSCVPGVRLRITTHMSLAYGLMTSVEPPSTRLMTSLSGWTETLGAGLLM